LLDKGIVKKNEIILSDHSVQKQKQKNKQTNKNLVLNIILAETGCHHFITLLQTKQKNNIIIIHQKLTDNNFFLIVFICILKN